MRLWGCSEPPRSGALPMLATDPAAWTCSTVQSHSNSLPLFFYLLPQGATTERSDYPPIKSWQFAAINRDCDSQAAWQFLRTGLQHLICSKSYKMHPALHTWPDGCTILGTVMDWAHLRLEGEGGGPDPHKGPADLTVALHIIELLIYLKGWRWWWKKCNNHDGGSKSINVNGFLLNMITTHCVAPNLCLHVHHGCSDSRMLGEVCPCGEVLFVG